MIKLKIMDVVMFSFNFKKGFFIFYDTARQKLFAMVTQKPMNTKRPHQFFPDKFLKKFLSFMVFSQIVKSYSG